MKKVKMSPKNTPLTPTNKGHGSRGGKNQKPIKKKRESLKPRGAMKKLKITPKNTPLPPTNKGHGSQGGKNQKPIKKGKEPLKPKGPTIEGTLLWGIKIEIETRYCIFTGVLPTQNFKSSFD